MVVGNSGWIPAWDWTKFSVIKVKEKKNSCQKIVKYVFLFYEFNHSILYCNHKLIEISGGGGYIK